MTDRELVTALKAGDRLAAGQMYDTYGTRLYAYCHELLGDHKAAGEALRDTFIVAVNRVRELSRPDEFGSWLYAIARAECSRIGVSEDIPADAADAARGDRLARFALDCYAMLPPETREVLDLAFRHRLVDADLARVLAMPEAEAADFVTAAQADLENTLLVVLAARTGDPKCAEAAELGRGFDRLDGEEMDSWLETTGKHVDRCEICSATVKNRRPLRLFEELPHSFMPPGVRSRVLESLRDPAGVDFANRIADRAGEFDEDGFPIPDGDRPNARRLLIPLGIGAGVFAVGVVGFLLLTSGGSQAAPTASSTARTSTSASATPSTSGVSAIALPSGASLPATQTSSAQQSSAAATQCTTVYTSTPMPTYTLVPTTTTTVSVTESPTTTTLTNAAITPPVVATVTTSVPVTTTETVPATYTSPTTYNSPTSYQTCN